jgi:hypothetical protein
MEIFQYLITIAKYLVIGLIIYYVVQKSTNDMSTFSILGLIVIIIVVSFLCDMSHHLMVKNKSVLTQCPKCHCRLIDLDTGRASRYDSKEGFNGDEEEETDEATGEPKKVQIREICVDPEAQKKYQDYRDEKRKKVKAQNSEIIDNEMEYSQNKNISKSIGAEADKAYHDYEYGYSFMPPSLWAPYWEKPPVCECQKRCPTQPVYTSGSYADLKEVDDSRRVMGADAINIPYIQNKLNSGK